MATREMMTVEEAFARLAVCVEHGKIVNGFPTCVRLNEPKAKRILVEFAESIVVHERQTK